MKITRRTALLSPRPPRSALPPRPALRAEEPPTRCASSSPTPCPTSTCTSTASAPGLILAHQAWDMLVHRDPATFEIKPVARHRLEVHRRQLARPHDPPGREVPRRQRAHAPTTSSTRINMAADPASKVATPSNYAWIDKAEKTGDFDRAHQDEAADAGGARISRHGDADPSQGLSREGRARGLLGQADRRRPLQDRARTSRARKSCFERFDDYWAGSPKGKPAIKKLHVRFVPDLATAVTELLAQRADWIWNINPDQADEHQQDAVPAGGAAGIDAHRLSLDRRRRPHRRGQSADQAQGAPGDLARRRPPGDAPTSWSAAAAACRRRPASRASSAAMPMPR